MRAAALRRALAALCLAAAAAGLVACSGSLSEVVQKNPIPGIREGEWEAVRNGATRRARLYDQFSQRVTVTATYLGAPEREARVRRLAEWMGWTEEEKAARLKVEMDEVAKYDDFVVALYTADRHDNDLDAKSSVWRIALKQEGVDSVSHDATTLDVNATLGNLFPYVSPFDTVYRVRFDKVPGGPLSGRTFVLELASARGKLKMTFGDGTVGPDRPAGTPMPP